jgi:hypothetical protein
MLLAAITIIFHLVSIASVTRAPFFSKNSCRLAASQKPVQDALSDLRRPLKDLLVGRLVELPVEFVEQSRRSVHSASSKIKIGNGFAPPFGGLGWTALTAFLCLLMTHSNSSFLFSCVGHF